MILGRFGQRPVVPQSLQGKGLGQGEIARTKTLDNCVLSRAVMKHDTEVLKCHQCHYETEGRHDNMHRHMVVKHNMAKDDPAVLAVKAKRQEESRF
jgi:hypothetical protein